MSELEDLESKGSLVEGNPEDKGIGEYGNTKGLSALKKEYNAIIGSKRQQNDLKVVSEIGKKIDAGELGDIPLERLLVVDQKMRPQQIEGRHEHTVTFMDWAKKMTVELEKYQDIDEK